MLEMQETWVPSLGRDDPLEKEMATHCSTLALKIPWAEEPGVLQSRGLKQSDSTEHTYMSHTLKSENLLPPVLFFLKTLEILI